VSEPQVETASTPVDETPETAPAEVREPDTSGGEGADS
jgi:hypothetical protein